MLWHHYSLCKNIRRNFSLHILSYIRDIAIYDIFNHFLDILAQLTSNIFTGTVDIAKDHV